MTLIAVTRVLNEADIIEAFVRHTAHFVDRHLFIDNGSIDGTLTILRALQQEGFPLTIFHSRSRSFVEAAALTFLYRAAVVDHRADWVVLLDADEFIDDRRLARPLRDHLSRCRASVKVRLREYHATSDDNADLIVPRRMTRCEAATDNMKIIAKADLLARGVSILPGSHSARLDDGAECPHRVEPLLTYAHFPNRSPYQWLSKSVIGWAKVLAAGPGAVAAGHAAHYRDPFEFLRTDPQAILRNAFLMEPRLRPDLPSDPIAYRGGDLRYTVPTDYAMRATRVITQYLHDLAVQHGEMLERARQAGSAIPRGEREIEF